MCYLSPHKLSQPEENTPHPLLQVERLTAEGLPSKLHNHNLYNAKQASLTINIQQEHKWYLK